MLSPEEKRNGDAATTLETGLILCSSAGGYALPCQALSGSGLEGQPNHPVFGWSSHGGGWWSIIFLRSDSAPAVSSWPVLPRWHQDFRLRDIGLEGLSPSTPSSEKEGRTRPPRAMACRWCGGGDLDADAPPFARYSPTRPVLPSISRT